MDELENLCLPVGGYLEDFYEIIATKNEVNADKTRRRKSAADLVQMLQQRSKNENYQELLQFAEKEGWKNVSRCKLRSVDSYIPSYPMIHTRRGMHPCDVFASVIDRDVFSLCADSTYDNMIVQPGASTCGSVRPFSGAEIAC